jgi:hypothetical protein
MKHCPPSAPPLPPFMKLCPRSPSRQVRGGDIDGLCASVVGFVGKAVRMMDEESTSGGKIRDLK